MAKNFKALQAKMSPQSHARAQAKADAILRSMSLDELREALELTQEELASRLKIKQPAVAKLERREDVRIRTLRGLIEAMGGELEVRAVFPQGAVLLGQYGEAGKATRSAAKSSTSPTPAAAAARARRT
jgi:transcriptional regulator with XRE-family HTH domain